jgi:hypothetical protein
MKKCECVNFDKDSNPVGISMVFSSLRLSKFFLMFIIGTLRYAILCFNNLLAYDRASEMHREELTVTSGGYIFNVLMYGLVDFVQWLVG